MWDEQTAFNYQCNIVSYSTKKRDNIFELNFNLGDTSIPKKTTFEDLDIV